MSFWVWAVACLLEVVMLVASFRSDYHFGELLWVNLKNLDRDQFVYMAKWAKRSQAITKVGMIPVLCGLIAVFTGSAEWMTICLSLGAICFTLSWHITSTLNSKLKGIAKGSKDKATERKKDK